MINHISALRTTEEELEPRAQACSTIVLIPTYGAAVKLQLCLNSLVACRSHNCTVFVLDDGTPDDTVRTCCLEIQQSTFSDLRYVRREENEGFVSTCNWGVREFWDGHSDLLLLNSDTEVTTGFLHEMQDVLHMHEKHAIVVPRSNNATIFSMPSTGARLTPECSFDLWSRMHQLLPRYNNMPTAVGFCMLIKAEIVERFGLFDEIYGPGYNEENDFACRINRRGYSVVAANWAFVFHSEASSFGGRREDLEIRNRATLLQRYPEYLQNVEAYLRVHMDAVEHFAQLYKPHRPRILYDLFHLPAAYNGTSDFGLTLLRELTFQLEAEYELYVGIGNEARAFFSTELWGYRFYVDDPRSAEVFDLIFKPSQMFEWSEYERAIRLAPRVSYTLQDIISVRCGYLNSPGKQTLFRQAAELSDRVFTISRASYADFEAFYGKAVPMTVICHGSDLHGVGVETRSNEQILIVGNELYFHKGVEDAIEQLAGVWPLVVLGGYRPELSQTSSNVRRLRSGHLAKQYLRQLFLQSKIVVYPSYYEGCGLPVLDALALKKPVIVLDSTINREIFNLTNDPNLQIVNSLKDLSPRIGYILAQGAPSLSPSPVRKWSAVGEEYGEALRRMISQEIDYGKLRARWDLRRCVNTLSCN